MLRLLASSLLCVCLFAGCVSSSASPSPSPSLASSSPSPGPSADTSHEPAGETASASPTQSTVPSTEPLPRRLATDRWVVVATDALNLRDGPSLDAEVLGTAPHGQLVEVVDAATIVDDTPWYPVRVVAGFARAGWMAGEQGAELLLEPATGTIEQSWCGRMEAAVIEYEGGLRTLPLVRFAGLQIPSDLFEAGMAGALSVAWGADKDICMHLTVTDAELVAATVPSLELEVCGMSGFSAANDMILFGRDLAVSPGGTGAERLIWLHEALLGFQLPPVPDLPNVVQALLLSAYSQVQSCIAVQAAGGLGSTSLSVEVTVVDCVSVVARSSSQLILARFSLLNGVGLPLPFDIVPNSQVGPEFVPGTRLGARVSAAGGPAGAISVQAVSIPDCG
jgi:hypothetical protein